MSSDFQDIAIIVSELVQGIVTLLIGLGLAYFLWGVLKYMNAGGDTAKRSEGRGMMIYGIIALTVMVGIWGFVEIIINTFGIDTSLVPNPCLVPGAC